MRRLILLAFVAINFGLIFGAVYHAADASKLEQVPSESKRDDDR